MWQLYVFSFVAGLFGANGVPHFVKGITGQKHPTPFGKSSSAIINVIWGWVNFVAAALFLYFGHVHPHLLRSFALVSLGALLIALVLAINWSKSPGLNK
ncbi:MAG: hypothetical protein ABSB12_03385 [Candidatus Saccharimonadales bacterium]|jgi:hypothetical protein